MAAIFGEGKIFGKLQRLHSLDPPVKIFGKLQRLHSLDTLFAIFQKFSPPQKWRPF